jgi:CRISPR system Cascade subunit CasD
MAHNTVYLRLQGPMQAWGGQARLVYRDTDRIPGKSGVLGLLCAALGLSRAAAGAVLPRLRALRMAVRVDHPGCLQTDYHTVGALVGNMAAEGKLKITATSGEKETLVSQREYLADADFLVALHGDPATVSECAHALQNPVWPLFLGRKAFPPAQPIYAGVGDHADLTAALTAAPGPAHACPAWLEHSAGPLPPDARIVQDDPQSFAPPLHGPRAIVSATITPATILTPWTPDADPGRRPVDYSSSQWRAVRGKRLDADTYTCIFCKAPATQVHHLTYQSSGAETPAELRSLCDLCHDAVTILEYGENMGLLRIDPCAAEYRTKILHQRHLIVTQRALQAKQHRLRRED